MAKEREIPHRSYRSLSAPGAPAAAAGRPGRRVARVAVALVLALATAPWSARAQLFKGTEPELVFELETSRLDPGVIVVRDEAQYRLAETASGMQLADEMPDLERYTLLVIVGRDREDDCRRTLLREVGTRFRTAAVTVEEYEAGPGCGCSPQPATRTVFGVLVGRYVSKAKLQVDRYALDCSGGTVKPEPGSGGVAGGPRSGSLGDSAGVAEGSAAGVEELLRGTLVKGTPGVRLLDHGDDYALVCAELNQADSCPGVDFRRSKVMVAVGQPLQNGCRRTESEGVSVRDGVATIGLREIFPAPDRMCTQIFGGYQTFVYRVPRAVQTVEIVSRKVQ